MLSTGVTEVLTPASAIQRRKRKAPKLEVKRMNWPSSKCRARALLKGSCAQADPPTMMTSTPLIASARSVVSMFSRAKPWLAWPEISIPPFFSIAARADANSGTSARFTENPLRVMSAAKVWPELPVPSTANLGLSIQRISR